MSPEQFTSQPVDGRSDLFSCGVILYQLLTGEKPFTGESTTTIMYKVLREEPVPPSELNLALTPELDAVLKKALAKSPAQRFQSGREFSNALQVAIAAEPVAAPRALPAAGAGRATPAAARRAGAAAAARTPANGGRSRNAAAWWVVGAAASVALVAGAYLLLAPGRQAAAPVAQAPVAVALRRSSRRHRLRPVRCRAPAAVPLHAAPCPRPTPA